MSQESPRASFVEHMDAQLRDAIRNRAAFLRTVADAVERQATFPHGKHHWAVQNVQGEILGSLPALALDGLYARAVDLDLAELADKADSSDAEMVG